MNNFLDGFILNHTLLKKDRPTQKMRGRSPSLKELE